MKKFFRKIIRNAIKNDIYALLDEVDRLRVDSFKETKNTYDLVFASLLVKKVSPKLLAQHMKAEKVLEFVNKFQSELDKIDEKLEKKLKKDIISSVKKSKKATKKLNK